MAAQYTEEQIERIWNLQNGRDTDVQELSKQAHIAFYLFDYNPWAASAHAKSAEKRIAFIEDAIKRYREGRKQAYEED
jgi:hypothetical protein